MSVARESTKELRGLIEHLKSNETSNIQNVLGKLEKIAELRQDENIQIINGIMNEALSEAHDETDLEYRSIIKIWVSSMFPDTEVK